MALKKSSSRRLGVCVEVFGWGPDGNTTKLVLARTKQRRRQPGMRLSILPTMIRKAQIAAPSLTDPSRLSSARLRQ